MPLITYMVAIKGHHIRFFSKNQQDCDRSGNVRAGFVANEGIVSVLGWENWYLQSHGGILGSK